MLYFRSTDHSFQQYVAVAGSKIPVMRSIGGSAICLVKVSIGFTLFVVGFVLSTRWNWAPA
jgi:hypothetical protein